MTDTTQEIVKQNTVAIHGKDYLTVAGRVQLYHEDNKTDLLITTRNRIEAGYVIVEAEVRSQKGLFTGTSAVELASSKQIEKENPFEVAETSAIGRALGFANYGLTDSIASADEIKKAQTVSANVPHPAVVKAQAIRETRQPLSDEGIMLFACEECGANATMKSGTSQKTGKPWKGVFCSADREHVKWLRDEEQGKPQPKPKDEPAPVEPIEQEVEPSDIPF